MTFFNNLLSQVDDIHDEIITLEQDLVKIPSVNTGKMPTGNETQVCEYIHKWLKKYDISSEIIESVPGRGNIIAKLPGKIDENGLLYMSHTDVVPVENAEKWEYPPFSAILKNGRIYGRGASDCKGLLTAQLIALRILKQNNIQLNKNIVLLSAADEEHGGRYGVKWLADNHPEKITADFAINEGGGRVLRSAGSIIYMIGVGEKGRLQVEMTIRGSSAHASIPWKGENALFTLAEVLKRLSNYLPAKDVSLEFFNYLPNLAIEDKPEPGNIDEIISSIEKNNPPLASMLRALSRITITPTMVNGGIKSNSVPETINLTCDVRTLPHQTIEYLENELNTLLTDLPNVEFSIDYMAIPNSSPIKSPFVDILKNVTSQVVKKNNLQWIPTISTGFTDSRFTRDLGVPTYGFEGAHPDDDPLIINVHGTNESEAVSTIITGAKIMLGTALELLTD